MVWKELIWDQFKFHLSQKSVKNRGRSSLVGELNCFKGESAIPVCNQLDQIVANGPICINRPDWIALMGPGRDINNTSSRLTVHFPTQCKQRTPSSPNLEPLGHKRPSPLQSVVSVVQAHCLGVLVHTKELSLQIPSPPPKPPLWTDWINTWQRLNGLVKHTQ